MTIEKFKIVSEFIKDMSSETPNIQTFLFVKENISKYHLSIEINSKALKDKVIEIETSTNDQPEELGDDVQSVDLEVRKVNQDLPVNTDDYPDLMEDKSNDQKMDDIEEEIKEEEIEEEAQVIEDLPEPEDWENDDVPLFKSDRLDNNEDDKDFDSQMEIPAFLRKNKQ